MAEAKLISIPAELAKTLKTSILIYSAASSGSFPAIADFFDEITDVQCQGDDAEFTDKNSDVYHCYHGVHYHLTVKRLNKQQTHDQKVPRG